MEKNKFIKDSDYIICIDSDGCAMDTMNIKHKKYFGPLLIKEWKIKDEDKFMEIWNKINLFSRTRGINRFKGFLLSFKEMEKLGEKIADTDQIEKWINNTDELSNKSLKNEMEKLKKDNVDEEKIHQLEKLLNWSESVNTGIKELENIDRPFEGVKEALEAMAGVSEVAVVSSANKEAIISEWTRHGLLNYTNVIFSQEEGSKSDCLKKIRQYGYENKKILMVGDSPGDLEAALENEVLFYPILFGKEKEMWEELINVAKEKFLNNEYAGEYQDSLIEMFNKNLSDNK